MHSDAEHDPAASIRAVSALNDNFRRRMFDFIRRAKRPITRDEAAAEVGISRKLAAFHLDKLVAAGLLRSRDQAIRGIRKVGRAPKTYEPTDVDLQVKIPPRQPDILAGILLDAVTTHDEADSVVDSAYRAAHRRGEQAGRRERSRQRPGRLSAERALTLTETALTQIGFEPTRDTPTCLRLRSCPFHPLAAEQPEIVCGINHAFLTGLLTGLGATAAKAILNPGTGSCCVELTTRSANEQT
jgi:predicted ArsR family transcriptional regulator